MLLGDYMKAGDKLRKHIDEMICCGNLCDPNKAKEVLESIYDDLISMEKILEVKPIMFNEVDTLIIRGVEI